MSDNIQFAALILFFPNMEHTQLVIVQVVFLRGHRFGILNVHTDHKRHPRLGRHIQNPAKQLQQC